MGAGNLKALIFDCDGVLIDSEMLASRVESELARELDLVLTVDEAHDLFFGKTVDGVLDAIAARTGQRPPIAFVYNWAFATAHAFLAGLKAIPFVLEAAEALRRRGVRLAVASQSPLARVRFSLDVAGFASFFGQHVYVTSMVPRPKPAPDVYLLAAARLGVEPGECIVVEDSPAGAASARAAGFRAIGYVADDAHANAVRAMQETGVEMIRSMDLLLPAIDG